MWKSILAFAALVASAANAASSAASTCDSYEEANLLQLPTTLSPDEQDEKETAERIEEEHKRVLAAETASETGEATVEEDVTLSPDEQDEKETAERIEKEHKRLLAAETASETGEATVEEDATLSPDEQDEKETAERIEKEHKRLLAAETASETGEATVEEDATEATVEEDGDATRTASMTSVGNRPKCAQDGKYGIIVVDMQNDFVEADGSLPVAGAEEIIPTINKLVNELEWDFTTFTEDFHPRDHISFAVNSPLKKEPFDFVTLSYDQSLKICGTEYESVYGPMAAGDCSEKITLASFEQELWPKHCIQNTEGQQFHADLKIPLDAFILRKGVNSITDSYGAFYDNIGMHLDDDAPPETSFQIETGLFGALQLAGVQHVFLTGVAEDYCVKYTALQALKEGFGVYLVTDATKPVMEAQGEEALEDLKQKGAKLIKSCEVLGTCECSS